MKSVFRLAIGSCSCKENQPDLVRREACKTLAEMLANLHEWEPEPLVALPPFQSEEQSIEGYRVRFETIREEIGEAETAFVVRAFIHTWRWPTWLSLSGVGHMLAEGFVLLSDGSREAAPDEVMWSFR